MQALMGKLITFAADYVIELQIAEFHHGLIRVDDYVSRIDDQDRVGKTAKYVKLLLHHGVEAKDQGSWKGHFIHDIGKELAPTIEKASVGFRQQEGVVNRSLRDGPSAAPVGGE